VKDSYLILLIDGTSRLTSTLAHWRRRALETWYPQMELHTLVFSRNFSIRRGCNCTVLTFGHTVTGFELGPQGQSRNINYGTGLFISSFALLS